MMKWLLIFAILFGEVDVAIPAEDSLGTKIKKVFEPSPTPSRKHRKKKSTPTPSPESSPKRKKASPSPSPTATPKSKSKRKKASPTPTPSESPWATEPLSASPAETPEPARGKKGWPNASLSPDQIANYDSDPPKVRQILEAGLALTQENLGYTYGSAAPAHGGMDCSGF